MNAWKRSLDFAWVAVAGAALALAAGFLLWAPQPEVVQDARGYLQAALALVPASGQPWNDLTASQFLRAPWYVLSMALVGNVAYPLGGEVAMVTAVRLMQAGFHAGSVGLIYGLGLHLTRQRRWGLLAAVLAMLYAPLVFMTGRLLVEVQVTLCLLLAMWFWFRQRPGWCGLVLFVGFSNSWLSFWPKALVFAGLAGLMLRFRGGSAPRPVLTVLAILLGGGLVQQMLAAMLPHAAISPSALWYHADTLGYPTLLEANSMRTFWELNGLHTFVNYMQGHGAGAQDILAWLVRFPQVFFTVAGANLFRLFWQPENVYGQSYLGLSPGAQVLFQQMVALAALLGLLQLWWRHPGWRLLAVFPLVWTVYILGHIEARYKLPVMPCLLLLAAGGLMDLRQRSIRFRIGWALVVLGLPVLWRWTPYPVLAYVWGGMPLGGFTLVLMLGTVALIAVLAFRLFGAWQAAQWRLPVSRGFAACLLGLLFWLPALAHFALTGARSEWSVPLRQAGDPVVQRTIELPAAFWEDPPMTIFLVLDAYPPVQPDHEDLLITLNGLPVSSVTRPPTVLGRLDYLLGGLLRPEIIRQYRMIPLSAELVDSMRDLGRATVQVTRHPQAVGPVGVYGDYAQNGADRFVIPSPDWGLFSTYKAQYDGDGRMPESVAASGRSALLAEARIPARSRDLSTRFGLQTGEYRIFLLGLLPQDAGNPEMPAPNFHQHPQTGRLFKFHRLAY